MINLIDILIPQKPPEIQGARLISSDEFETSAHLRKLKREWYARNREDVCRGARVKYWEKKG